MIVMHGMHSNDGFEHRVLLHVMLWILDRSGENNFHSCNFFSRLMDIKW